MLFIVKTKTSGLLSCSCVTPLWCPEGCQITLNFKMSFEIRERNQVKTSLQVTTRCLCFFCLHLGPYSAEMLCRPSAHGWLPKRLPHPFNLFSRNLAFLLNSFLTIFSGGHSAESPRSKDIPLIPLFNPLPLSEPQNLFYSPNTQNFVWGAQMYFDFYSEMFYSFCSSNIVTDRYA